MKVDEEITLEHPHDLQLQVDGHRGVNDNDAEGSNPQR